MLNRENDSTACIIDSCLGCGRLHIVHLISMSKISKVKDLALILLISVFGLSFSVKKWDVHLQ